MKMIEKMARAMGMVVYERDGLEKATEIVNGCWQDWIPEARAALEALLEPSDKMTEAGDDVEMYGVSVLSIGESQTVFCTMIQAALDEI